MAMNNRLDRATRHRSTFVVVALLVAACSSDTAPQPSTAAAPDAGRDPSIAEIGTSEEIGHIMDIAEADDGTIWVLNETAPFFVALSPDGEVLRAWGRQGGGPSEFRNPSTLISGSTGVWVYDRGHHTIMRVDGPEDPVESIMIPRDSIRAGRIASMDQAGTGGDRGWVRSTDSGFLVAVQGPGETSMGRLWTANIVHLDRDGSTRRVFALGDRLGDAASRFGKADLEFMPYPVWAVCPDRTAAVYDPISNTVVRINSDDTDGARVQLPPERRLELTLDRVFRMAYSFIRDQAPAGLRPDSALVYAQLESEWKDVAGEVAPVFPEYADLQCTGDNTLWIQLFDPDRGSMGQGPAWLRIDSAGTISQIEFPEEFEPFRFQADDVLGVVRDDLDIESVARMRLPGGGGN